MNAFILDQVDGMTEYGIELVLETENQYRTVKFSVAKEPTPEEAEKKLDAWIKKHPKLLKKAINKDIHTLVFEE